MCSIIRENPGPEVTVKALAPPQTPPCNAIDAASSSSIWMNVPPTVGMRAAKRSTTSVEGVIGYPAENRAPAARAPSQQAWSPSRKWEPVSTPAGSACVCIRGLLYLRRGGRGLRGFLLFCVRRIFETKDGEIGAIHAAEVAAAAFVGVNHVGRVIALGVEGGRERKNVGGTELHAEPTGLAALHNDLNRTFCHAVFPWRGGGDSPHFPKEGK